jgi:hypothetical protein
MPAWDTYEAVRPGNGETDASLQVVRVDGSEAGEAHYAVLIEAGETIWMGDGRKLRVVDVLPVEEDASPFVGLLRVELAA